MKPNFVHLILGVCHSTKVFVPRLDFFSAPRFAHTEELHERQLHLKIAQHHISVSRMATLPSPVQPMPLALQNHLVELDGIPPHSNSLSSSAAPPTLVTIPSEIRLEIYDMSGCLELKHWRCEKLPFRGDDKGADGAREFEALFPDSSTSGRM